MSTFHRQPSRVYWDSDIYSHPFYRPQPHNHRAQSSSPGSQDSGFSDTETSPTNAHHKANLSPKNHIDISVNNNNVTTIKVTSLVSDNSKQQVAKTDVIDNNLLENAKEKFTPVKSNLRQLFEDRYKNGGPGPGAKSVSPKSLDFVASTPAVRRPINSNICTEPVTHIHRYNKRNTNKVNRNLFKSIQSLDRNEKHSNQYATNTTTTEVHLSHNNANEENTRDDDQSDKSNYSITKIPEETQSLPNIVSSSISTDKTELANLSAPTILPEVQVKLNQEEIELCQTDVEIDDCKDKNENSDCDSEVEEIFPEHTSTPKHGPVAIMKKDRLRKKLYKDKLLLKYKDERVPPIVYNIDDYSDASLKAWYTDLHDDYEPECMTALQGKSIAGELADRVARLAANKTRHLREIIHDAIVIYTEIDVLNGSQLISLQPHCSTLSTYIRSYLTKHPQALRDNPPTALRHHCMELSTLKSTPTKTYIDQLAADFTTVHSAVLSAQVRQYLREELAAPHSELDVRAAVTGLTSVCLHYGEGMATRGVGLVEAFVNGGTKTEEIFEQGAMELLVALCEICEGSSVRRVILRALATVCATGVAVGRFESSGGVEKAIVDVVTDDALPEVERVEAIALLAQISAPWIDQPPSSLPSIHPHLRPLIRSLTIFAHTSTCKQNLLLCSAALANLTTLYMDCVSHIISFRTVDVLLKCLKKDGQVANSCSIEVYILEQVAIVVANVSATGEGRSYLTATPNTSTALVCFLQTKPYTCPAANYNSDLFSAEDTGNHPDDVAVVQRLQQKTIIALSRLCGDTKAAHHVVKMGGVRRLVMLCREKGERYGSDAVLVAALATLRKISETCGATIMTEQDAQELVEPRLLDSFLAYSAQNESLV